VEVSRQPTKASRSSPCCVEPSLRTSLVALRLTTMTSTPTPVSISEMSPPPPPVPRSTTSTSVNPPSSRPSARSNRRSLSTTQSSTDPQTAASSSSPSSTRPPSSSTANVPPPTFSPPKPPPLQFQASTNGHANDEHNRAGGDGDSEPGVGDEGKTAEELEIEEEQCPSCTGPNVPLPPNGSGRGETGGLTWISCSRCKLQLAFSSSLSSSYPHVSEVQTSLKSEASPEGSVANVEIPEAVLPLFGATRSKVNGDYRPIEASICYNTGR
jgi:hypothetical protein